MIKKEIIIFGLKVSYKISADFDSNRAVVFLPGWKSPVDLFCSVAGDISNVVALNLPGWGGSERPKEAWGLVEYAKFVKEFLNKLQINQPILIGHSIGGAIAVECIANDQIAKELIIISGAIIRNKSVKTRMMYIAAKIFRFLFPFINKRWRRRLAGRAYSMDYVQAGELEDIYKKLINEDKQESFTKLTLPIILIWGKDDQDTPYSQAERLKNLQPAAILETIYQAGHYCFLDQPAAFKEILFKHL